MNDTERAGWLADKLHNGGDYGKEAAALLVKQAHEVERLRGIVPEVMERLNDELCAENERLRAALRIAREGYASEAITGLPVLPQWRERTMALIDDALGPNVGIEPPRSGRLE